ncbi:MAG: ribosomal protein L7/L12 [Acidimicrobiales bacterium]
MVDPDDGRSSSITSTPVSGAISFFERFRDQGQQLLDRRRRAQQMRRGIDQKVGEYLVTLVDPETMAEARDLVDQGKPILAIKRVRERTGLGLKEAKVVVDGLDR